MDDDGERVFVDDFVAGAEDDAIDPLDRKYDAGHSADCGRPLFDQVSKCRLLHGPFREDVIYLGTGRAIHGDSERIPDVTGELDQDANGPAKWELCAEHIRKTSGEREFAIGRLDEVVAHF